MTNTPSKKAALLLFPNLLADLKHHEPFLPASVDKAMSTIDGIIAESSKGGMRFLSRFQTKKPVHEMPFALLNKYNQEFDFLLEPILKGERWGLVSDCGLPCIADPGALLVKRAREKGVKIQAFNGPSSITLALMLSGLPSQSFHFLGYLDKGEKGRQKAIEKINKEAKTTTQIFIEAPHRNLELFEHLIKQLDDQATLCIAKELTTADQKVISQKMSHWKKTPPPNIDKKPTLFLVRHF